MAFGDLRGSLVGGATSITNPLDATGSVSVSVGDLIVAVIGERGSDTTTAFTDNLGNTYTRQTYTNGFTSKLQLGWSIATAAGTLSAVHAATTASSNDAAIVAGVFAGPFDVSPLDKNVFAADTTNLASPWTMPSSGTLSQADELVLGAMAGNNSATVTATSPNLLAASKVSGASDGTANSECICLGYQVVAATTAVAPVFAKASTSFSANARLTITFKKGASGTNYSVSTTESGSASTTSTGPALYARSTTETASASSTQTGLPTYPRSVSESAAATSTQKARKRVWTQRTTGGSRVWYDVAVSSDGSKLVAIFNSGQIYTSSDYGATWTARDSSRAWYGIASSADGTKLVATVQSGQIYTSTDSGVTWTPRDSSRLWYKVASSNDGSVLVATAETSGADNLYLSTDSGVTWTAKASALSWYGIAMSGDGSKMCATAQAANIYNSTDTGATWTSRDSTRFWLGCCASEDGTRMAAVVNGDHIFTSSDSGATWTSQAGSAAQNWRAIACSADGRKLVAASPGAASNGYLYTSDDYGVTWVQETTPGQHDWRGVSVSDDFSIITAVDGAGYVWTGILEFADGVTESGSASSSQSAGSLYNVSVSESGSATASQTGLPTYPRSASESGSAADSESIAAAFVASRTESGSAADSASTTAAFVSSRTETASASDSPTGPATYPRSTTETGSATVGQTTTAERSPWSPGSGGFDQDRDRISYRYHRWCRCLPPVNDRNRLRDSQPDGQSNLSKIGIR